MALVRKRFVEVDGRIVHYRIAGSGIPVVLLHESPRSSRSLVPLLEALGQRFRVIAPDTPGYGDSTALPAEFPPLSEFAEALAGFLDVIGVPGCVLYGSHTGGSIAAEFAERYPERVAGLILDGFAMFTDAEQADMVAHYLPPFEPKWDGSHITSLWSRARDLFTYFPYHRRDPEHRISTELFSLDASYRTVLGFLESGWHYRGGYRASITHQAAKSLLSISVPTSVVCREGDLLRHHLERVPAGAACSRLALPDDQAKWIQGIESLVEQYGASLDDMAGDIADPWCDAYMDVEGQQMRIRRFGTSRGRAVLFLHDLPGSGADSQLLSGMLGTGYTVLAPDLPGAADSDFLAGEQADARTLANRLSGVLDDSGVERAIVLSSGAATMVGSDLCQRNPIRFPVHIANLLGTDYLSTPPELPRQLVPDGTPRAGGGHLTDAWFQLRDGLYYAPWNNRRSTQRRARDPEGRVDLVQGRFLAWMKGPKVEKLAQMICANCTESAAPTVSLADADERAVAAAIESREL